MTLLSGKRAFAKRKFLAKYNVNKMCQSPTSGDCYFMLGTLLPLPRNKPCVVAPKMWAGSVLGVVSCFTRGTHLGFLHPGRGGEALSSPPSSVSPVSCRTEERAQTSIRAESTSFECKWNTQGNCAKKGDVFLALMLLTPALQIRPDFLNLKDLTLLVQV